MTTAVEELRAALIEVSSNAFERGDVHPSVARLIVAAKAHLRTFIDIAESCVELAEAHYVATGTSHPDLDEACVKMGLVTREELNARSELRRMQLNREEFAKNPGAFAVRYGGAPIVGPRTKGGKR